MYKKVLFFVVLLLAYILSFAQSQQIPSQNRLKPFFSGTLLPNATQPGQTIVVNRKAASSLL